MPGNNNTAGVRSGKGSSLGKVTPLPCADGAVLLAQGSRAPTQDLIFHVSCILLFCNQGCSLCASPPRSEKKTCMISYMKDICNWTAVPMQYCYDSMQNTLKAASPCCWPFFLRKCISTCSVDQKEYTYISHLNVQNAQTLSTYIS